jgi:hypothetical protein
MDLKAALRQFMSRAETCNPSAENGHGLLHIVLHFTSDNLAVPPPGTGPHKRLVASYGRDARIGHSASGAHLRELQSTLAACVIALEISGRNARALALQHRWNGLRTTHGR